MRSSVVLLVLLWLSSGSSLSAATLSVPGSFPTIQAAINASQQGDIVEVGPGVYLEQIDFLGKVLHVRSTDGPASTIIQGTNMQRVVLFTSGEASDSVLEGFTVRDGFVPDPGLDAGGGGIYCFESSPTIRGNVIRDNSAPWNGAGIYCVDSDAVIENNEFIGNSFNALIADAPFGQGAGVCIVGGSVTVRENLFQGNIAPNFGGAIYCRDTQMSVIENNRIRGNLGGFGGGIAIVGNSMVEVHNNLIVNNTAIGHTSFIGPGAGFGGGLYIEGASTAVITNATVVGNEAVPGFSGPGEGGGLYADTMLALLPPIRNCIVRGNNAGAAAQLGAAFTVSHSDVEGGFPGVGNFDADPLFASNSNGDFFLSQVAAGQAVNSPCLDAGDPSAPLIPGGTTRTDGGLDTGTIDVGYHFTSVAALFRRGDCNSDGLTNIADAVFLLGALFPGGGPANLIPCQDACDANDDGGLNIADAITTLNALFGVPPVILPAPTGSCGSDPTPDVLSCTLSPAC